MLRLEHILPFNFTSDELSLRQPSAPNRSLTEKDDQWVTATQQYALIDQAALQNSVQTQSNEAPRPRFSGDSNALLGCLLGGALGDACGAPVEFLEWTEIQQRFGDLGIQDLQPAYGRLGSVTDDTQMMLFTAEGLLRAYVGEHQDGATDTLNLVHHAYMRWLRTQNEQHNHDITGITIDGWLVQERRLWARRAPSMTCIKALKSAQQLGEMANNDSKGCAGLVRVAPCAFMPNPFACAVQFAQLTQGHPTGYLAAGLFADILARLWLTPELSLLTATSNSLDEHQDKAGIEETYWLLQKVLSLHNRGIEPTAQLIETQLGSGWMADETLAIGLWCALSATSFTDGIFKAVNHSGDSDGTGLITGHFLGLLLGPQTMPSEWLSHLELRSSIEQIASDLSLTSDPANLNDSSLDAAFWQRYPS